jgi:hypothetical protein
MSLSPNQLFSPGMQATPSRNRGGCRANHHDRVPDYLGELCPGAQIHGDCLPPLAPKPFRRRLLPPAYALSRP